MELKLNDKKNNICSVSSPLHFCHQFLISTDNFDIILSQFIRCSKVSLVLLRLRQLLLLNCYYWQNFFLLAFKNFIFPIAFNFWINFYCWEITAKYQFLYFWSIILYILIGFYLKTLNFCFDFFNWTLAIK